MEGKLNRGVIIAVSNVAPHSGFGLFANRNFKAGEIVTTYEGELKSETEVMEMDDETSTYVLNVGKGVYIDAKDKRSCYGRYINSTPGDPNVEFVSSDFSLDDIVDDIYDMEDVEDDDGGREDEDLCGEEDIDVFAYVVAKRDIKAGEELLAWYSKKDPDYASLRR